MSIRKFSDIIKEAEEEDNIIEKRLATVDIRTNVDEQPDVYPNDELMAQNEHAIESGKLPDILQCRDEEQAIKEGLLEEENDETFKIVLENQRLHDDCVMTKIVLHGVPIPVDDVYIGTGSRFNPIEVDDRIDLGRDLCNECARVLNAIPTYYGLLNFVCTECRDIVAMDADTQNEMMETLDDWEQHQKDDKEHREDKDFM